MQRRGMCGEERFAGAEGYFHGTESQERQGGRAAVRSIGKVFAGNRETMPPLWDLRRMYLSFPSLRGTAPHKGKAGKKAIGRGA